MSIGRSTLDSLDECVNANCDFRRDPVAEAERTYREIVEAEGPDIIYSAFD